MDSQQEYLYSFINYERELHKKKYTDFKLERIRLLLEHLKNPQDKLKIIHIAGSKGKGSTALIIANILKYSGIKVGLYSSPHIETFYERIRILDLNQSKEMIQEKEFGKIVERIKGICEELREEGLSFFEILTAVAIEYFYQKKVNWVILETGLGGRLDATNSVNSKIAVITNIYLETSAYFRKNIKRNSL